MVTPAHTLAVLLAAAATAAAAPAWAHDPEAEAGNDHGKLATSDATPVGAGVLEISLAWQPSWIRAGHGEFERTGGGLAQPVVLGLLGGLTDDVDVGVSLAWNSLYQSEAPAAGLAAAHGEGLSDVLVAARWRFLCTPVLDLAVIGGVVAPTGAKETATHLGFTQGFWSGQVALVASLDEGPFTANLEGGVSAPLPGAVTDDVAAAFANAAAGVHLASWLQPALELSWLRAYERSGSGVEVVAATAGVVLPLPGGYGLTAGVQHALWGRNLPDATTALLSVKRSF